MQELNEILGRVFYPFYDSETLGFTLSGEELENLGLTNFLNSLLACPSSHFYLLKNLPSFEEYLFNTRQVLSTESLLNFCDEINQFIQIQQENPKSTFFPVTDAEINAITARNTWTNYVSAINIMNRNYEKNNHIISVLIETLNQWGYKYPEMILEQCIDYLKNYALIAVYFHAGPKETLSHYELMNVFQKGDPSDLRKKKESILIENISLKDSEYSDLETPIKEDIFYNTLSRPRYGKYLFISSLDDLVHNSDVDLNHSRRIYYGESFILLSNMMKFNATFTHCDSFHLSQNTMNCDYHYLHLLLYQDFDLFKRLARCAFENDLSQMNQRPDYIEAQLSAVNLFREQIYQIHFSENEIKPDRHEEISPLFEKYQVKKSYGENAIPKELVNYFFDAVIQNKHNIVRGCLRDFVYLNLIKHEKLLAIELAAGLGHAETLSVLLKPRLFTGSFTFSRALTFALANKKEEVIPLLLKAGAKIDEAEAILEGLNLPWNVTELLALNNTPNHFSFWNNPIFQDKQSNNQPEENTNENPSGKIPLK